MTRIIKVNNIEIGSPPAKICVPVFGVDQNELMGHVNEVLSKKPDLIEFRADYLIKEHSLSEILKITEKVKKQIDKNDIPLIFTFRTSTLNDERNLDKTNYETLIKRVSRDNLAHIIDIESQYANSNPKLVNEITKTMPAIISYHDEVSKPDSKENSMENIFNTRLYAEAENIIIKIAVNITNKEDLDNLKSLSDRIGNQADLPLIIIGMGEKGLDTRIHPEIYNSSITFKKLGKGTAPGQIDF